ncbi:MAG: hypothetical protein RLY14_2782, partial [Planctomycetota bacterium]|jgi:hypothetical protein
LLGSADRRAIVWLYRGVRAFTSYRKSVIPKIARRLIDTINATGMGTISELDVEKHGSDWIEVLSYGKREESIVFGVRVRIASQWMLTSTSDHRANLIETASMITITAESFSQK